MKATQTFFIVIAVIVLLLLSMSMYTVQEGQNAILLRLGKIETNSQGQAVVETPGLYFKWPFINSVRRFDMRLQTMDETHLRIVTAEKKDVLVDYYAKWRIEDIPLYYKRTSGMSSRARALLQQKLDDGLRAEFGKRHISEVVSGDRVDIMNILRMITAESAKSFGIKIVDVRIKRIDLPTEVSDSVFDRMRAERSRIAKEHLAKGRAKAEEIRANADAQAEVIRAQAQSQAQHIRGQGDGLAAQIYAQAYSKDPKFYAFYRSLHAYTKTFGNKHDILVLRPNSQFFKYFNSAHGNGKTATR